MTGNLICNNITCLASWNLTVRPAMSQACIQFTDYTLGYRHHAAVHHLNGTVHQGTLTALVGANGSGKSTLLKGIVGALRPMTGRCQIARKQRIAYLPQQSELDRSFPADVWSLVSLGLWPRRGLLGRHCQQDRAAIADALHTVGLQGFERRGLDTLSGGQVQRALFARVLVQNANLILLDEPFNAIDANTLDALLVLIKQWQHEGRTVLVVVHDLDLVRAHFPQTLLLARELIAWGETQATLTPDNLALARQQHESWNEHAPWCVITETANDTMPDAHAQTRPA